MSLWSRLVDAFVDVVLPATGRLSGARIVAVATDEGLSLHRVARGRTAPLGRAEPASRRELKADHVELRLPADRVLRRTLRLPAAGQDYFAAILEHRLDRLTPWRPDQVLFGFKAAGPAEADGQIAVDFAATSTAIAEAAEAALGRAGLVATALGPDGDPLEVPLTLDLWRGARDPSRRRVRRAVVAFGLGCLVVLGPASAASFVFAARQDARLAAVETRFAAVRRAIVAAAGDGSVRDRARALLEAKREDTAVIVLVDAIAAALPDDTFLRRLEIGADRVRLVGLSANAPALIARVDAIAALGDVAFAAPVVRDAEGRDNFDIVAARRQGEGGQ